MGKGFTELILADPDFSITLKKSDVDKSLANPDYATWVEFDPPRKPTQKQPKIYQITESQFSELLRFLRDQIVK